MVNDEELFPRDLLVAIRKWKPYMLDLERLIRETRFGQITVTLRIHDGFVTDTVETVIAKRKKYPMPKREGVEGDVPED